MRVHQCLVGHTELVNPPADENTTTGDTSWFPPIIPDVFRGLLTANPDINGYAYEYADGIYIGLPVYDELGIPVQNLTLALRTDEQNLFCDWAERNEPTYNIFYSAGGNFQSRTGVDGGDDGARKGAEIPATVIVPHVMREVTAADCNPDRPNEAGFRHVAGARQTSWRDVRRMNESNPAGESAVGDLVLELTGVSRQFGAVRALTDVSFDCRAGEVHALVGENGSGKSTLLGIASGFVKPDLGTVRIGGQPLRRDSPALARKLGSGNGLPGHFAGPGGAGEEQPLFWPRPRSASAVLAP